MKVFVKEIKGKLVPVTQNFSGFSEVGEVWNDETKEFDEYLSSNKEMCTMKNSIALKKYIYSVVGSLPSHNFKEGDKINSRDVNCIKPIWK